MPMRKMKKDTAQTFKAFRSGFIFFSHPSPKLIPHHYCCGSTETISRKPTNSFVGGIEILVVFFFRLLYNLSVAP